MSFRRIHETRIRGFEARVRRFGVGIVSSVLPFTILVDSACYSLEKTDQAVSESEGLEVVVSSNNDEGGSVEPSTYGWSHRESTDGWSHLSAEQRVAVGFLSQSTSETLITIENRFDYVENCGQADKYLDVCGGYSRTVNWVNSPGGIKVTCPEMLVTPGCQSSESGGSAVIPNGLRAELQLIAPEEGDGVIRLQVSPNVESLAFDASVAALDVMVTALTGPSSAVNKAELAKIAYVLLPDTAGLIEAIRSGDSERAWSEGIALVQHIQNLVKVFAAKLGIKQLVKKLIPLEWAVTGTMVYIELVGILAQYVGYKYDKLTDTTDTTITIEYTARCPSDEWVYNPQNGHCYTMTEPLPWLSAKYRARALGGHLVVVNDATENAWLVSTFGGAEELWIGYSDHLTEGIWTWVEGSSSYENWYYYACINESEPNDTPPGEDAAIINYHNQTTPCEDGRAIHAPGAWNDIPVADHNPGIVEWEENSNR